MQALPFGRQLRSPEIGRFIQADPIGTDGGLNLYAYVQNDLLNQTDLTGTGPVGWIVELTASGLRQIRPLYSMAEAIAARKAEQNVSMLRRQTAGAVERAADAGAGNVIRHSGHELPSGGFGRPHFQSEGRRGHTFYEVGAAVLAGLEVGLRLLESLDPTHVTSVGCASLTCSGLQLSPEIPGATK